MMFIEAMHIYKFKDGRIKLKTSGKYIWAIPKRLEEENISLGDIVLVPCKKNNAPVIVLNVFENNNKKFGYKHKKVIKVLDKMIKK
ncbi:DUF5839 family protein [Clostridium perfringens]|uniref:Uncharacterized protein n=1 Tax=Clostridium perfringens E str. JGS1987 TaxID=451755 RepID=B1BYI7_CLOPF|nr:DUF5839 family protein [Clostridium perfringens]EDT13238.1 hypothetical protein AC3_A0261 [Clostridium perfringens E str. JGS1987]